MENIFLITITLFALYYIYKTTFKNNSCNCGSKKCPTKKNTTNE